MRELVIRVRELLLKVVVSSLTIYLAASSLTAFGGISTVLALTALVVASLLMSLRKALIITVATSLITYLVGLTALPQALIIASVSIVSKGISRLRHYLFIIYSISLMYYVTYYVSKPLPILVACITVGTALLLITYEGISGMGSQEGVAKLVFKASLITLLAYLISWLSPVIPTVVIFGASAITFLLAIDRIAKYVK